MKGWQITIQIFVYIFFGILLYLGLFAHQKWAETIIIGWVILNAVNSLLTFLFFDRMKDFVKRKTLPFYIGIPVIYLFAMVGWYWCALVMIITSIAEFFLFYRRQHLQ